ncbi:uncharacterized protein LOC129911719 [Episyrphus balteatus]|uniref:uncharacterized protein LOC129911719 n=1 Tax=Episyrphus balteatus TaxID=286459 RepID=UPI0024861752|nr:uncharacterized protein LOC129911719 [Episyrphus balteatus]
MSGKTFVVICALLFVQLASARVARDAPANPELPLADLLSKAGDMLKEVQGKVFEAVGVQNQEQFNNFVATETKAYATKLDGLAKELKKTADENIEKIGESDAVKQLRTRVDEAINNLKKDNPEAANNVDQLTKTTKSLIEGISNLGDSESAKQIKDIGNQILQTTVDALKDVNTKIQQAGKA